MLEIKLVNYQAPEPESPYLKNRLYRLNTPGHEFRFKSKRKLLRFLADLNRHLNLVVHDMNFLAADVYREYRVYYFHLSPRDRAQTEASFAGINKMFRLLVTRSNSPSSNGYTYAWTRRILDSMEDVTRLLQLQPMNKISTMQRYRLENLLQRITTLRSQVGWYPEEGYVERKDYDVW